MRLALDNDFFQFILFTREKSSHPKFQYVNLFSKYRLCFRHPAGHGFNCDEIASFHQPSAALALRRSLEFLAAHVG
jgi:hypothetical protein